jgi:hypothetical protein
VSLHEHLGDVINWHTCPYLIFIYLGCGDMDKEKNPIWVPPVQPDECITPVQLDELAHMHTYVRFIYLFTWGVVIWSRKRTPLRLSSWIRLTSAETGKNGPPLGALSRSNELVTLHPGMPVRPGCFVCSNGFAAQSLSCTSGRLSSSWHDRVTLC